MPGCGICFINQDDIKASPDRYKEKGGLSTALYCYAVYQTLFRHFITQRQLHFLIRITVDIR